MSQLCQFETVAPGVLECRLCKHQKRTDHPPTRVVRRCPKARQAAPVAAPPRPVAASQGDDPFPYWWPTDSDGNIISQLELEPENLPCPHRGDRVRTALCQLCFDRNAPYTVFQCEQFGECSLIERTRGKSLADCLKCPTRLSAIRHPLGTLPVVTAAPPPPPRRVVEVAVVISCHNYGRFLAEAIESVLAQTVRPAEILVVDDRSTDNTEPVARWHEDRGVGFVRIEDGSELRTRLAGLRRTSAPWLVFLDADDALDPNYVEAALDVALEGNDPAVAAVGSDFQLFGDLTGSTVLAPRDIRQQNWLHAGSLVRRIAVESTRALEASLPADALKDWSTWRTLAAAGWTFRRQTAARYRYRKHGHSMTADRNDRGVAYPDLAHLAGERVTVATLVGGREDLWRRVAAWNGQNDWPARQTAVHMLDASGRGIARQIREALADLNDRETRVATIPADPSLPRADRRDPSVAARVRQHMPRLYTALFAGISTEYVLTLEDDILPPVDVIARLLRHMAPDVALVGTAYQSRWSKNWLAWDGDVANLRPEKGREVEAVGGTGFGCAIVRRSVVDRIPFRGDARRDYDVEFCRLARELGFRILVDWNTEAQHG